MDWRTQGAVDNLKIWVNMRVPYPDIARRLGTTTGAVCGKVHRLKIGKGPRDPDRLFLKAKKPSKPQLTPDAAFFAIMERQEEEALARFGATVTLDTSHDDCCRYVIGDPTKRQLCGAQRRPGTPYCEVHAALCLEHRPPIALSSEVRRDRQFMARRAFIASASRQADVAFTPIDPRTFEEADAPEPVASAA